jgi:hypothetical protein
MFSAAQDRDADELNILQHVHVHDAWANLSEATQMALIVLRNQLLDKYETLLHVKLNAAGEKISGCHGATINGFNSQVLEGM